MAYGLLAICILVNVATLGTYASNISTLINMNEQDIAKMRKEVDSRVKTQPPEMLRTFFNGKTDTISSLKQ
jgi:hypothetical protein